MILQGQFAVFKRNLYQPIVYFLKKDVYPNNNL